MPIWECDDDVWETIAMCIVECGHDDLLNEINELDCECVKAKPVIIKDNKKKKKNKQCSD
jgi:phage regulator Rha-like protein